MKWTLSNQWLDSYDLISSRMATIVIISHVSEAQLDEINCAKVGYRLQENPMAPHPKFTIFSQVKIAPKPSITVPNYSRDTGFLYTRQKPLFEEVKISNVLANTQHSKLRSIVRPYQITAQHLGQWTERRCWSRLSFRSKDIVHAWWGHLKAHGVRCRHSVWRTSDPFLEKGPGLLQFGQLQVK